MSVTLLSWDAPGPYEVAFSTRLGGVSEGSFDSLNLGLMTHDEPANVEENRRRLCEAAGAETERSRRLPSCTRDDWDCSTASLMQALPHSAATSRR